MAADRATLHRASIRHTGYRSATIGAPTCVPRGSIALALVLCTVAITTTPNLVAPCHPWHASRCTCPLPAHPRVG
eukprot:scaffold168023_cov39-Tisochrysis_lutea.AAC.2